MVNYYTKRKHANTNSSVRNTREKIINVISIMKLTNKLQLYSVNKKIQVDATVRRHLFTTKSLYMFRTSLRPSSGVLKTVTATSGIGNIDAAASFQRGLIRTGRKQLHQYY
jgi:hypothetical protein